MFEADSPFQRWQRDGDLAHGPGAGDDKGGMAVMVAALRAMQAAGNFEKRQHHRRPHRRRGGCGDAAVHFSPRPDRRGQEEPTPRSTSKGWRSRTARTWARSPGAAPAAGRSPSPARARHSSGVGQPGTGYGAIYELARIIDQFRRELPEDKLTFNVGLIGGGQSADLDAGKIRLQATGKTNIVAATAVARGDLRAISQEQIERVQARMRAIVAQSWRRQGGHQLRRERLSADAADGGNRALLGQFNGVNRDLGLAEMGELDPLERGAGDISFVAADVDGLVGLGPASFGDHTPKETSKSGPRQAGRSAPRS